MANQLLKQDRGPVSQFPDDDDSVDFRITGDKPDHFAAIGRDILVVTGGLLVVAGTWLVYMPAALIVAGSLLLAAAIAGARRA